MWLSLKNNEDCDFKCSMFIPFTSYTKNTHNHKFPIQLFIFIFNVRGLRLYKNKSLHLQRVKYLELI